MTEISLSFLDKIKLQALRILPSFDVNLISKNLVSEIEESKELSKVNK